MNSLFPGSVLLPPRRRGTASRLMLDRLKYYLDVLVLCACAKRKSAKIDGTVVAHMRRLIEEYNNYERIMVFWEQVHESKGGRQWRWMLKVVFFTADFI